MADRGSAASVFFAIRVAAKALSVTTRDTHEITRIEQILLSGYPEDPMLAHLEATLMRLAPPVLLNPTGRFLMPMDKYDGVHSVG